VLQRLHIYSRWSLTSYIWRLKQSTIGIIGTTATVVGFASQTLAFGLRWAEFYDIGRMGVLRSIPLTNLYESLVFFVWCLILGYLVIEWKYKPAHSGPSSSHRRHYPRFPQVFRRFDGDTAPCPGTAEQLASCACDNELHCLFGFCHFLCRCANVPGRDRGRQEEFPYIFWTVTLALFITSFVAMGFDFVTLRISAKSPEAFIQIISSRQAS